MTYGEIARRGIALPPVPPSSDSADLEADSAFRLIGHDTMRVELPQKVNGSAQYAIDVQVPGMLYATVLRAPVEGCVRPRQIDDTRGTRDRGRHPHRTSRLWRRRAR